MDVPSEAHDADADSSDEYETEPYDVESDFDGSEIVPLKGLLEIAVKEDLLPVAGIPKELLPRINERTGFRTFEVFPRKRIVSPIVKKYVVDIIKNKHNDKYKDILGDIGLKNAEICENYGLNLKRTERWLQTDKTGGSFHGAKGRPSFLSDSSEEMLRVEIERRAADQQSMSVKEGVEKLKVLLRSNGVPNAVITRPTFMEYLRKMAVLGRQASTNLV